MKKLKLKMDSKAIMTKEQMKNITGGDVYGAWCLDYANRAVFIDLWPCDTALGAYACSEYYYPATFMMCGYLNEY